MRSLTVCLITFAALAVAVIAYEPVAVGRLSNARRGQELPCYVVISNESHDGNTRREIETLLDKADVSEANFARLHRHFSAMYPDAERLTVYVKTSLNFTIGNYKTVEDVEALRAISAGGSYVRKPKIWEKDAQGVLVRIGRMEKFGYKVEGGDMGDMKYVLVKGEDPYCHDCKRVGTDIGATPVTGRSEPGKTQDYVPCYFVIKDSVVDHQRFIRVFINAEDGSESTLLSLLRHFSRQHPEPEPLVIKAYTSLKQTYGFVQELGLDLPAMREHFVAALFRDSGNEVIRYRHPHENVTTVVVQGLDVFPDLDDYRGTEGYRPP